MTAKAPAKATVLRKDYTDLLDLPAATTDDQVLAELDTRFTAKAANDAAIEARAEATAQIASMDSALYQSAFGWCG